MALTINEVVLLDLTPRYDEHVEQIVATVKRAGKLEFIVVEDLPIELYVEGSDAGFIPKLNELLRETRYSGGQCRPLCPTCKSPRPMQLVTNALDAREKLRSRLGDTHSFALRGIRKRAYEEIDGCGVGDGDEDDESDEDSDGEDDSRDGGGSGGLGNANREYLPRCMCKNHLAASRAKIVGDHDIIQAFDYSYYHEDKLPFVRLKLSHACYASEVAKAIHNLLPGRGVFNLDTSAVSCLMKVGDIASFDVLEIPKGTGRIRFADLKKSDKIFDASELKILNFDIETIAKGTYFKAETTLSVYPVGAISVTFQDGNGPIQSKRFTWRPKRDASDADTELAMIRDFFKLVKKDFDPDIIGGFNSNAYDIPYLCRRAIALGATPVEALSWTCRIPGMITHIHSALVRKMDLSFIDAPGRIIVDYMPIMKARLSLDTYTLRNCAIALELTEQKGEMDMKKMYDSFYGNDENLRNQMLEYCDQDVLTTHCMGNAIDIRRTIAANCRILRLRAQDSLDRGVGFRLSFLMGKALRVDGFLMRCPPKGTPNPIHMKIQGFEELWVNKMKGIKYKGAQMIEPIRGFIRMCMAILDFNSLYPNLMRTFNICSSTCIAQGLSPEHADHEVHKSPDGFMFSKRRQGIFPKVAAYLIDARNEVRERQKTETDKVKWATMEAEQLAFKVAANAMYGLTGTVTSALAFIPAAASITSWGRQKILAMKAAVEARYPSVQVVYGDTDSIFISLGENVKDPFAFAAELEAFVNTGAGVAEGTLKMELECIGSLSLLLSKKKYAMYNMATKKKKAHLKIRGLIKRDMVPFTRRVAKEFLERVLVKNETQEEIEIFIAKELRSVIHGSAPREEFRKTGGLSKPLQDYDATLTAPHIAAARILDKLGVELRAGDRVAYYMGDVPASKRQQTKKGSYAVPEAKIEGYELKWDFYAEEVLRKLKESGIEHYLSPEAIERLDRMVELASSAPRSKRLRIEELDVKAPAGSFSFAKRRKETKTSMDSATDAMMKKLDQQVNR